MSPSRSIAVTLAIVLPAALWGSPGDPGDPGDPETEAAAPEDGDWLREADLLLGPEEREAYRSLEAEYRRQAFRERFWALRDPYPSTPVNEMRERWSQRWHEAGERWRSRDDPRARIHLLHGDPETKETARCGEVTAEIWSWERSELLAQPFRLAFREAPDGGAELVAPARLEAGRPGCGAGILDWAAVEPGLLAAMRPDPGWVRDFLAGAVGPPEEGVSVDGEVELFSVPSAGAGGGSAARIAVRLPARAFPPRPGDGTPMRELLVDGEVLRRDALHDRFRYRFELPAADSDVATFEVAIERALQPGPYRLRLRARDAHGRSYFLTDAAIVVPAAQPAPGMPPPQGDGPAVRLRPLPDTLLTGTVRVAAAVTGRTVDRVRFDLDGQEVLTKRRPPYSVELSLGDQPRRRIVRATALDAGGRELARDELAVNVGPHRFAVRLVAPRPGPAVAADLRAVAVVEIPRGERLERVEIFLDEVRLATLYQPPFVQVLPALPTEPLSFVRAVAYLEGGASAEDLVFLHAPAGLDAVDIQMVELYTTVLDRHRRPVAGLGREAFRVLEDGREQQILRFTASQDVPLHAGILLDTSTSMAERIDEAERAALGFLHQILEERDRAAVLTFDDAPRLRVPFTNRKEVLAGGLADLAVTGETALYDSLVYALYYFSGIRGKRTLLLLSDGEDVRSRYGFDDVLELARRSGVAIYAVGIDLPGDAVQARNVLLRLASETGGRAFFVSRAGSLLRVLGTIEEELRSQYLLAYQSDAGDADRYRAVEVVLADPELEARTMAGYYP